MRYVLAVCLLCNIFLISCVGVDFDENPPLELRPYTSESDFRSALAGAYRPLYSGWVGFDYAYPLIMCSGAEDVKSLAGIYKDFDNLQVSDEGQVIEGIWKQLYQCIANANTIIGSLDGVENIPEERLNAIEGQAKFIRALSFFYLVRWFGEVQLSTFESQNDSGNSIAQSSVSDIYSSITEDLKAAENKLPDSFSDKGRPTKWAAKSLLAKVYLSMAGWPLEQTDNYAMARDKALEVIEAGVYTLENNFVDLWKESNKFNNEFIFTFYGSIAQDGISGSHMHTASRHSGNGENGWGDFYSESRFFNAFPEGPRKEASFTTIFADETSWQDAGVEPFISKYRDAGRTVGNSGEGFFCILRYADVLLMYAEAANMAEGAPSAEAYTAINKVRRRAMGLSPNTPDPAIDLTGLSQADFDKAVLEERNWELAFEANRWFDLVRKKKVVEVNSALHEGVSENNRLFPKPASQLVAGKLEQNPGY